MEDNIVMEQANQNQEYNNMETPDYPVEVTYLPPQDDSKDSDSIGGAEIAVGGFAIAGVAAVGYGIYRGIKTLINKIKGSDEEEEEEEEKPRKKKVKKVSKKKVKKAPAKKKPEPEEEDDEDYEVEESDEDTED